MSPLERIILWAAIVWFIITESLDRLNEAAHEALSIIEEDPR
jgi:hypothetical protein